MARRKYKPDPNQLEFGLTAGDTPKFSPEGVTYSMNSRRRRKAHAGKQYLLDAVDSAKLPALDIEGRVSAHFVADLVDRSIPMNEDLRRENWHAAAERVATFSKSVGQYKPSILAYFMAIYGAPRDQDPNPTERSKRKSFIGWLMHTNPLYDVTCYPELKSYLKPKVA